MATENELGPVGTEQKLYRIPRQASAPALRRPLPGRRIADEPTTARPSGPMSAEEVSGCQLDILRKVDAFCAAHEIHWYLAYGTLLGAVRHGGYIPWDDDIDLMMPRQDYERFCATFNRSENAGATYRLGCSANTPGWAYPFAKVGDRRTTLHEGSRFPAALGVNIDVFPIDAFPSGWARRATSTAVTNLLRRMHTAKYVLPRQGRSLRKRVTLALIQTVLRPVSITRITTWWTRWALGASAQDSTTWAVRVGPGHWEVPSSALADTAPVVFEGMSLPAPADSDRVLSEIYGDYLQLPPEHKRVSHHAFSAHWGSCIPAESAEVSSLAD